MARKIYLIKNVLSSLYHAETNEFLANCRHNLIFLCEG